MQNHRWLQSVWLACTIATLVYCAHAGARLALAGTLAPTDLRPSCPNPALGETQADCPWARVARQLIADAGSKKGKALSATLARLLPDLDRSLRTDSSRTAWKNLWGRSINFDELAKNEIVDPAILLMLEKKFGIQSPMLVDAVSERRIRENSAADLLGRPSATDPSGHALAHAGLEHTYGYLLSVLRTPFGYKRARWVQGEIERGFGLKPGLLGPQPERGTLFTNVTYFAGRIAFRGDAPETAILGEGAQDVPSQLRDFDFAKLKPLRLEETVEGRDEAGQSRKVILRTDCVPFTKAQKNTHLLIYSVRDPSVGGSQLISAFPVDASFVANLSRPGDLGEAKPVKTRYNAFVEGITGRELKGSRKLHNP